MERGGVMVSPGGKPAVRWAMGGGRTSRASLPSYCELHLGEGLRRWRVENLRGNGGSMKTFY